MCSMDGDFYIDTVFPGWDQEEKKNTLNQWRDDCRLRNTRMSIRQGPPFQIQVLSPSPSLLLPAMLIHPTDTHWRQTVQDTVLSTKNGKRRKTRQDFEGTMWHDGLWDGQWTMWSHMSKVWNMWVDKTSLRSSGGMLGLLCSNRTTDTKPST